ncbi:MAG: SMP-30/gluconolactonase/LRE family protein [Desulfitobacteriaceae bacterium]|nr:SMP-30/gluconolactonase/LRE family protein [Desulfitobacteriaceae bacterium]MDI6877824.1 SMP-30/gluconolactonase/LRE family protein [Desulfitobacteriaceae bacterium]MDI6912775.1 SMP-30/gluconolactonase/LRE family protein [Desulfitobacteriaceae bacterium]
MRQMKRERLKLVGIIVLLIVLGVSGFLAVRIFNTPKGLPLTAEAIKSGPPHFLYALYGEGLKRPLAVTVAPDGRIFVADTGNSQIQEFSPNGKHLVSFGRGKLNYPFALLYYDHKLYVADPNLMKVFVFNDKGEELPAFADKLHLPAASMSGDVVRPTAIQVGPDGNFYITDVGNQCIIVLDGNGRVISYFGSAGKGDGQFQYPNGLWVNKKGDIYVADSNNGRIEIFDNQGRYLFKVDGTQGKVGPLTLPRGIAVTEDGTILVVDVFLHTVRAFDPAGNELWVFGGMGMSNGQFNFPNGLYIDQLGRILVTDRENNRVQVFGY